jgi:uncharacterized OB-fold protein
MIEDRPLPFIDDAGQGFWAASIQHELRIQRCTGCGHFRYPPPPMCPRCQSMTAEWTRMSGRGRVYSFVVVHPPVLPAFASRCPFPVVLVELEEDPGLRLVGGWAGPIPEGGIQIGAPVEVVFEDVAPDVSLPNWRLGGGAG